MPADQAGYADRVKLLILVAFCLTGLLGCDTSSSSNSIDFPFFDFQCNFSQSSDCSALGHNRKILAGLIFSSSAQCNQLLSASGSDLKNIFEFSSESTTEFTGLLLRATTSTWVDTEGETVTTAPSGTYTLCSYLDTNENNLIDSGEPFSQQSIDFSSLDQLIDQWEEF